MELTIPPECVGGVELPAESGGEKHTQMTGSVA
jgi:hypothetical protein